MRSKRENPYKKHEEYHFTKSKQTAPFVFNATPSVNQNLTVAQSLTVFSALYYLVHHADTPSTPHRSPHARSKESKTTCYSNATQAIKIPISPIKTFSPTSSPIFFHGHPVKDVTRKLTRCEKKLDGAATGKICHFNNKKYMLKKVIPDGLIFNGTNYLISLYLHTLLKDYIGICVPKMGYFYEKDGKISEFAYNLFEREIDSELYLGTEFIDGYIKNSDIYASVRNTIFPKENAINYPYNTFHSRDLIARSVSKQVRKNLSENDNETAKLLVATTFIDDLLLNEGNWGIADGKLVIVDMDSLGAISNPARAIHSINNTFIHLSANTIILMRNIYMDMLSKPAPKVNKKVDLSQADYEKLLQTYIDACTNALETIMDYNINAFAPSITINHILSNSIRNVAAKNNIATKRF